MDGKETIKCQDVKQSFLINSKVMLKEIRISTIVNVPLHLTGVM